MSAIWANRDLIVNLAKGVLTQTGGTQGLRTTRDLQAAVADAIGPGVEGQEIYDVLLHEATRELANYARKGEPRTVQRYGRDITTRPWVWADYGMPGPDATRRCPTCGAKLKD
jgi:hypothetical protein